VLLDAAAFVPTSRLDLRTVSPDFVVLSFYKMFGYPTGVGCLLVRNETLPPCGGPGSAAARSTIASVQGDGYYLQDDEAGFEDGTVNYLNIPAVEIGLRHLTAVGVDAIHTRVMCLTGWLLSELIGLRHANGAPLVRVYGPVDSMDMRGGTLTLNFYDPNGQARWTTGCIEELANAGACISLRTGCFCNPGAGEAAEDLNEGDMRAAIEQAGREINLQRFLHVMQARGGKTAGAIRVSTGLASNFADVERFMRFAEGFRDQTALTVGTVSFDIESCRVVRDGG
jgi:molybdenum cofactor sulfurtransferase